uniref:Uncharacterized protein n=1 Tax=Arundo donax TaxID=35708 RepID=A0A0A9F727_ARUDO
MKKTYCQGSDRSFHLCCALLSPIKLLCSLKGNSMLALLTLAVYMYTYISPLCIIISLFSSCRWNGR